MDEDVYNSPFFGAVSRRSPGCSKSSSPSKLRPRDTDSFHSVLELAVCIIATVRNFHKSVKAFGVRLLENTKVRIFVTLGPSWPNLQHQNLTCDA